MKLLFVTTDMASGGAQRVVSLLANKLSSEHSVGVITVQGDKVKYSLNKNVIYLPIVVKSVNKIRRVLERIITIRKMFKEFKPDVIISFETENNIYSIFCKMFLKTKLIISERNDPNNDPPSKITRLIRYFSYNFADGFVFQTEDAKLYFNKKIQDRSAIIPNPINETFIRDRYVGERNKEIVTVCRLYPQKNLKLFIDIIAGVTEIYPEYKGIIYGDGPEYSNLKKYADEVAKDKIIFAGFTTEVAEKIYKSSIYLCTSDYEGISNSLIEAMTLGLAVVATDCPIGGTGMAIKHNENGMLFKVNDKEAAIRHILKLINSDDTIENLGNSAQLIKEKWSIKVISDEWINFISHIIGGK